MAAATSVWRVRGEDGGGEGRRIQLGRLQQAVADGLLPEAAQVRAPQDDNWVLVGNHPQLEEFLPRKSLLGSSSAEEAEMDMTPMIDVTFQLIIFFMITATFIVQKTLDMPKATEPEQDTGSYTLTELKTQYILVAVSREGTITLDDQPVALDELTDRLAEAMKERESAELLLDIDDEVYHETAVQVIDSAAGAQIEKVYYVSRGPPGG